MLQPKSAAAEAGAENHEILATDQDANLHLAEPTLDDAAIEAEIRNAYEQLCATLCIAMQGYGGTSTAQLYDFHFAPGNTV